MLFIADVYGFLMLFIADAQIILLLKSKDDFKTSIVICFNLLLIFIYQERSFLVCHMKCVCNI